MKIFELIKENWEIIGMVVSPVFSFFVGRKSKKNMETSGELENIKTAREIEKKINEDIQDQVTKLMEYSNKLEVIIEKQRVIILNYKEKYGEI